ncbi:MAG: MBL fold metallo-hydrolase [Rubrobacteridae bacterium]|nr:MBL fold metallo-hydrolase [Rubrobacteridae bacterium]
MVSCSDNSSVTITWMGQSMFSIDHYKGLKIVTDPYSLKTGYKPPQTNPDILTISHYHHDHGTINAVGGKPEIIDKPGIYDYPDKDTSIEGLASYHYEVSGDKRGESIIYKFNFEGLVLVHMGDYGQALTDEHASFLENVDIMLIPVGGTYTIDHNQAAAIVHRAKPKIVIPMHYRTKHYSRQEVAPVDSFSNLMEYVRYKGSSVFIEQTRLPIETEVWVMEYSQ